MSAPIFVYTSHFLFHFPSPHAGRNLLQISGAFPTSTTHPLSTLSSLPIFQLLSLLSPPPLSTHCVIMPKRDKFRNERKDLSKTAPPSGARDDRQNSGDLRNQCSRDSSRSRSRPASPPKPIEKRRPPGSSASQASRQPSHGSSGNSHPHGAYSSYRHRPNTQKPPTKETKGFF